MALPTKTELQSMDYSWMGSPFVECPAKSGIDLTTMDYVWMGSPFVANPAAAVVGGVSTINLTPRIYRMIYYGGWL